MSQTFLIGIAAIIAGTLVAVVDPFVPLGNTFAEGAGDVLNGLAALVFFIIGTVLVFRGLRQRPS